MPGSGFGWAGQPPPSATAHLTVYHALCAHSRSLASSACACAPPGVSAVALDHGRCGNAHLQPPPNHPWLRPATRRLVWHRIDRAALCLEPRVATVRPSSIAIGRRCGPAAAALAADARRGARTAVAAAARASTIPRDSFRDGQRGKRRGFSARHPLFRAHGRFGGGCVILKLQDVAPWPAAGLRPPACSSPECAVRVRLCAAAQIVMP
jgi:hypothetical protein